MKLKLNVHKLEKGENEFTGIVMLNDEEFSLIIKNEQERKQIELPYSMGRLVPLSNFTSIPRSVLRLSIKCISPTSNTNDDLFVERKTHFEKRNESVKSKRRSLFILFFEELLELRFSLFLPCLKQLF